MMRRRSSSRCSRKLMPVISSDPRCWAFSMTGLGIVSGSVGCLGVGTDRLDTGGLGRNGSGRIWLGGGRKGRAGNRLDGRRDGWLEQLLRGKDLGARLGLALGAFFEFDVQHLGFKLVLELVAGLFELAEGLT